MRAVYINLDGDERPSTSGGESGECEHYEISFGDVMICRITPNQFCALALEMVNHAIANGHEFVIDSASNTMSMK